MCTYIRPSRAESEGICTSVHMSSQDILEIPENRRRMLSVCFILCAGKYKIW